MSASLSRLGQGRCQQFVSLLHFHQQLASVALHQQQQQHRTLADQAAVKYAKERKTFETSLSELRKQWAETRGEQEAAKAAAAAAAR
jgi:phage shock protein A